MIKKIKIGNLELKNNLFSAPLAQISNSAFRLLCLRGGAGMAASEMISSEALVRANKKTLKMLELFREEFPVHFQIFGYNPEHMSEAAILCEKAGAAAIDINAGCPVKKILHSGSGAALMKNPSILASIISKIKSKVKIPVTVKFRPGFEKNDLIAPQLAKICENSGADAVILHARRVSQVHSGEPDFKAVEETAKAIKIPLIGNGGITSSKEARNFFNSGCKAVSIGRTSISNPFIFNNIAAELSGGKADEMKASDKVKLFMEFLKLNSEIYGEDWGVIRARKLIGYWLKNIPNASFLRVDFMKAQNFREVEKIIKKYLSGFKNI